MTKKIRRLKRQFNLFGPRFQSWLARMLPAFMPVGMIPFVPGTTPQVNMTDAQCAEMNRLVALWVATAEPEMAG